MSDQKPIEDSAHHVGGESSADDSDLKLSDGGELRSPLEVLQERNAEEFKRLETYKNGDTRLDVELFKAREDAAETLEPPEEALDFIALLVQSAVVFPGFDAIRLGRNNRNHAQIEHELPGLVVLVGPIHQHRQPFRLQRQRL